MKYFLLGSAVLFTMYSFAQDETVKKMKAVAERTVKKDPDDTLPSLWRKGGVFGLNIAQGSLSNWAAGGDNFSLSLNSIFNYYAFYKNGKKSWDNTIDFNLGYVRTTSLGSRKNDDKFDVLSKYGYALIPKLSLAGLFNFRTQFFKGYTYPDNVKTFSSAFLSPAYILLSAGLDYKPTKNLSIFFSPITFRWIIVKDDSLSAKGYYGVAPGKKSKSEIGAFMSINYLKDFTKNFSYKGRLDLFSNYKANPGNIDLYMTNLFSVKISKVIAATWSLDMIYDDDVKLFGKNNNSPAMQVKSLVGIGVLVKF
jgi:Protein of unknown function (DUF3078)